MKREDNQRIGLIEQFVEAKRDDFIGLADRIWDLAETRWEEFRSVEAQIEMLEREGFRITRNLGGLPTAFVAQAGNEGPIAGFLGEYDALSNLSQQAAAVEACPVCAGGSGHGCGHHLLGVGAMLAAVATRDYLVSQDLRGIVRYFGCPAEEGGAGKTYMAREGVFDEIDFALTWHPGPFSGIFKYKSLAVIQAFFRFSGVASHAAASPHLGRSALDAVELMNVGVNFLREHMPAEARVHYAITDAGGLAANVVQALAEVLYVVRAPNIEQARALFERVRRIGAGAALMTETTVEVEVDRACSDVLRNEAIEALVMANLERFGPPPFDQSDRDFVTRLAGNISSGDLQECLAAYRGPADAHGLADMPLPLNDEPGSLTGSSDVGDVSWVVPTTQYLGACYAVGTNMHTWQLVSQGKLPAAHKGMLHAAKVLAATAVDLLTEPSRIGAAQAEHARLTGGRPYVCPIPESVLAPPLRKRTEKGNLT
ncbi:amidohydrolase [Burkholderia sp. R-69980]|nr:amidohydrolase [Burkholderia sp. R-69980]